MHRNTKLPKYLNLQNIYHPLALSATFLGSYSLFQYARQSSIGSKQVHMSPLPAIPHDKQVPVFNRLLSCLESNRGTSAIFIAHLQRAQLSDDEVSTLVKKAIKNARAVPLDALATKYSACKPMVIEQLLSATNNPEIFMHLLIA